MAAIIGGGGDGTGRVSGAAASDLATAGAAPTPTPNHLKKERLSMPNSLHPRTDPVKFLPC